MVVWGVGGCDEGVSEKGCGRVVGGAAGMDEGPAGLGIGKTGQMGGLGAMDGLPTESGIQTLDDSKVGGPLHHVERGRRERERDHWYHACVAETKKNYTPLLYRYFGRLDSSTCESSMRQ